MLSKSLIQFSVDVQGCVPFLLFDLKPNYGGGNEDNGNHLQKVHAHTGALTVPNPVVDHCQPTPLPETPGHSQTSLDQSLVGPLLLPPGCWCTEVCFVPSKSLFPQACVSSGGSMVGLIVTSSKRAYATPRSATPRAPTPAAGHC